MIFDGLLNGRNSENPQVTCNCNSLEYLNEVSKYNDIRSS